MTLDRSVRVFLCALLLGVWAPAPMAGQVLAAETQDSEEDEYFGLPEDTGRDEVAGICGACHSLKLVVQQRLPRYRWEELMVWMVEKQGMPQLEPEDEKLIVDYLAEHLAPAPRRRRF